MWVLSDIYSSLESGRLGVGDIVDIPAVLRNKRAPHPEVISDIDDFDTTTIIGGGGKGVSVANFSGGSTAIIGDPEVRKSERPNVRGYFIWEPYWYANYVGESEFSPHLHLKIDEIAVITYGDSRRFVPQGAYSRFSEIDEYVKKTGEGFSYRCMRITLMPGGSCTATTPEAMRGS